MIRVVDDVIGAIGGTAAAASLLGIGRSTVSSWRSRASIPAEHWQAIVKRARTLGREELTLEVLASIHARRGATVRRARQ